EAKHFRFAHTSFQEYSLARYLVRVLSDGKPERWSLPMASVETLDFLGQLMRRGPSGKALTTLTAILANDDTKVALLAFNYWLLAREQGLREPVPAFVNLPGTDLEGLGTCCRCQYPAPAQSKRSRRPGLGRAN